MATKTTGEISVADTHFRRGAVFEDINHDRVANAVRYLSYAKLYYPDEYQVFVKSVAIRRATWSIEDANFIAALYDFEAHFLEFLKNHPGVDQELSRMSPKEMVDRVDVELIEEARMRHDTARKIAQRAINNATNQQVLRLNEAEKEDLVQTVEKVIRSTVGEAQSTKNLQKTIDERISSALIHEKADKSPAAQQSIRDATASAIAEAATEDPTVMQRLLLSDKESGDMILDKMLFSVLPNKRALHTIITKLPMYPDETREEFLKRAEAVAQAAMVLSSDLSQTPATRAEPAALLSAIFEARGDRVVTALFKKLPERAKNAVALTTVAKAWEDTVDVIMKRAGGVLTPALNEIIQQGNARWGEVKGEPLGRVGALIGDVINPILRPALEQATYAELINRSLPPGGKILPDKTSVAIFVDSLAAVHKAEGAAGAALFLAAASWKEGVWFEERRGEGSLGPVAWTIRWAADSALGKIIDRATRGEAVRGFFGKILGFFGIQLGAKAAAGAAGAAAGKAAGGGAGTGIRALLARLGGTALGGAIGNIPGLIIGFVGGALIEPVLKKGWQFAVNLLSLNFGALGETINAFGGRFSARQRAGAVKKENKTSWLIGIFVCGAILFPVVWNISDQISFQSGQVTSFEEGAPASGGPYTEDFPPYDGPFPDGTTAIASCAVDHKHLSQDPFDRNSKIGTHKDSCAYDFDAPWGSVVSAAHDGYIVTARTSIRNSEFIEGSYGNYVLLAGTGPDGKPFYSVYAHLLQGSSSGLAEKQFISAGTPIGKVDNTGHSTGTHLHLEFLDENRKKPTEGQCLASFSLPAQCTQ